MTPDEEFWTESLRDSGATPVPEVPVNRQSFAGESHHHETIKLRWPNIAGYEWPTSYDAATIVQLAWALLVAQYTGSTDIAMRRAGGKCVFPIRIQLNWDMTIAEASRAVGEQSRQSMAHSANCHLGNIRSLSADTRRECDFQFTLTIRDSLDPASDLAVEDAATRLRDVNLLSSDDRCRVLSYNAEVPPRIDETVYQLLAQQAAKRPESQALDACDGQAIEN
ncbi:hypothetical protein DL764_009777 [Monosporascus ibericus]|uniref:Condensation domain-containing protein n=1 Tax=Monosporascus ibericus TaxID=155417 RepID=A0A4V1X8W0_9PEZI|nr:hypothetical protein DL764_009777 [Monosporascus ibericus]